MVSIKVNNEELKFKLGLTGLLKLEKELGLNPLNVLMSFNDKDMPELDVLFKIVKCACMENITSEQLSNKLDMWLDEGHTLMEFAGLVVDVFKDSGLLLDENNPKN